ncbi:MAG: hypothetical protein ACRCX8_06630 [Sarcina sp.]
MKKNRLAKVLVIGGALVLGALTFLDMVQPKGRIKNPLGAAPGIERIKNPLG